MSIYIDDQLVALSGSDLPTLLAAAKEHVATTQRVIVEVQLDGQTLAAKELDDAQRPITLASDLRFITAQPQELAGDALQLARELLTHAQDDMQSAADLFQQDQQKQAMDHVGKAMELWQQAQQAVLQSGVLLGLQIERMTLDGQPVSELITATLKQLRQLRDLLQARDTVSLADTLAYEWPQTTQRWQHLIDTLVRDL